MKSEMQTPYILGLDIGSNSVGWAVVDCKLDSEGRPLPVRLRDLNSYIFQEAVDNKEVPINAIRREKRLMRRQLARRASRRRRLVSTLRESGFLPQNWDADVANAVDCSFAGRVLSDPKAKSFIQNTDARMLTSPFAIRAYALDAKLEKHEFGRMILHLQRRRGFRSNRGAKYLDLLKHPDLRSVDINKGVDSEDKDEGKILGGIQHFADKMKQRGSRTVGEYVWEVARETGIPPARITTLSVHFAEVPRKERGDNPAGLDKVALYANREMTEAEFDLICEQQIKLGLEGLGNDTMEEIRVMLFEQFPIGIPPRRRRVKHLRYNTVGRCTLEPGRRRADKAALVSQEFRTWAVINNIAAMGGEIPSQERRQALFNACQNPERLNQQGRLNWTESSKILDIGKINYDRDNPDMKSGLIGNRVIRDLLGVIGADDWMRFAQDSGALGRLVEDMLTIADKRALYDRLTGHWQFSRGPDGVAFKLATLEMESGHMKYSQRAMSRMLPHMREGKNEHDAREAAGYKEVKSPFKPGDPAKELLPLDAIPDTANPRVQRALYAVRRVVNAIARRWGKPAEIRVEMPRDMKASKKHRGEIEKRQGMNRKRNTEAEKELIAHAKGKNPYQLPSLKGAFAGKSYVSRSDRDKFKMWKFEQNCQCPYCGTCIGIEDLMSESFEVDHILPQSAFRQSFMNTLVACRDCNRKKAGRTPWQAWKDTEQWQHIAERADLDNKKSRMPNLPRDKRRRILNKNPNLLDEEAFCNRALQDTQYISTLAHGFLSAADIPVQVSRGEATSILRREWGLEEVLPRHPDDELKETDFVDGVLRRDEKHIASAKNRRDHRHHAVDAFIVALTDHGLLQNLIKFCQLNDNRRGKKISDKIRPRPKYWDGSIFGQVRSHLQTKIVAHQRNNKVRGALHKETVYGREFYTQMIPWPKDGKALRGIKKLNLPGPVPDKDGETDADGDVYWISDAKLHAAFSNWITDPNNPPPDAKMPVARRIYTYRYDVADALKHAGGEWRPGAKQWIVDESIHRALSEWLNKHALKPNDSKGIKRALELDLPQTFARKGKRGNSIRTVKVALIGSSIVTIKSKARSDRPVSPHRSVYLRNNHHLEVFGNGRTRRARIVSMLESARRKQNAEPIVDCNPDAEWGAEWEFQCSLARDDLVIFDRKNMGSSIQNKLDEHLDLFHSSVYRVQKINMSDGRLDIYFRHHSVSSVEDEHGEIRIRSFADLIFQKIEVGVLGTDSSTLER